MPAVSPQQRRDTQLVEADWGYEYLTDGEHPLINV